MDPVSIIISVVIGAALTAASYLLTPKPKLDSPSGARQKQLGNINGLANYAPTQGFESIQDLAAYGKVVPIAFTLRQDHPEGFSTGGLLISPQLVWSRMKSWGSFQVLEMLTVAGQGKMLTPDQAGIFVGNNILDTIYESQYQFYWNSGFESGRTNSRALGSNLKYGTLQVPPPPSGSQEAFLAPSNQGIESNAFCGAFTPSNQTKFGVYAGVPNGTPYRPNWEIIQLLSDSPDETIDQQVTNSRKFVDPTVRARSSNPNGMPGIGRNYGRHVGVVSHNGYTVPNPTPITNVEGFTEWSGSLTAERTVNAGDTIEIYVGFGRQVVTPFAATGDAVPVRLDDIRSANDAEAVEYDRRFAVGSIFMIGRSTWQVTNRSAALFNPGGTHVVVTLKCLETWSTAFNKIGLVAKNAIQESNVIPYIADIAENWYPILKVDLANVRNTRPCDVTEIGIKSQVWSRFNGITNFNSVPGPSDLTSYSQKKVQVREGKNTSYARRTSFFTLDVRPANSENYRSYNNNEGFVFLTSFAVTGSTPQDIFSFIRITHPDRGAYEFRLRPQSSPVFSVQSDGSTPIFELNGALSPYQENSFSTYMGTFKVGGRGQFVQPKAYFTHSQMAAKPSELGTFIYGETRTVDKVTYLATYSNTDNRLADFVKVSNILSRALEDRGEAIYDPYFNALPVGYTKQLTNWTYSRDLPAQGIVMTLTLVAFRQAVAGSPRDMWWQVTKIEVTSKSGTWTNNDLFAKNAPDKAGEVWRFEYRYNLTTEYVPYSAPQAATRVWETYSGIAEVSHYGDLINRSCDSSPEHEIVYVNESMSEDSLIGYNNCAMMGLKLQSSNNFSSFDQVRCYIKTGLEVERLTDGGTGPSNLFTDLFWYLATNTDTGAGGLIDSTLIDRDQLADTGSYLRTNRLFFDDVISEPINLRSWLADKAPSMLCFIAIKNGKLSINPALPTNTSGVIANVAPEISAMFTDGNIIEGSFSLEWLQLEERKLFQAAVIYRTSSVNKLPQEQTVVVRYAGASGDALPIEEFNLPHVTSESHAIKAAKYFLALRKHITHTVTFRTLPYGLSLAPGQFIIVAVEESPYDPSNNGIVRSDGTVVSVFSLSDGSYSVYYWDRTQTTVGEGTLTVVNGIAQNLRNTVFSLKAVNTTNQVYQVEALDVDQDGIVTVKASSFPVDSQGRSLVAADVASDSNFEIIGQLEL